MKQKKNKSFNNSIIIGLLTTLFLGIGHLIFGIKLMHNISPTSFLTLDSYVFYLTTAFVGLISVLYVMNKKDISEGIAVFVVGIAGLYSGLLDLIIYSILGFPETSYAFLLNTPAGLFAKIIGSTTVSLVSLIINILLFGILTIGLVKILKKIEIGKWG